MKHSAAQNYIEWCADRTKILHQEGDYTYLSTPYLLPFDRDEYLAICLEQTGHTLRVSDASQIYGYFLRHFVDLLERKEPLHIAKHIATENDIKLVDGEFFVEYDVRESAPKIHEFCAELMAIASQLYQYAPQMACSAKAPKRSRLANQISKMFMNQHIAVQPYHDKIRQHALYKNTPIRLGNFPHSLDFCFQNGVYNAIDCYDFSGVTPKTAETNAMKAVAIANKMRSAYEGDWKYIALCSTPNAAILDKEDPLDFMQDQVDSLVRVDNPTERDNFLKMVHRAVASEA